MAILKEPNAVPLGMPARQWVAPTMAVALQVGWSR
ncbi:hypothetical protein N825_36040 [Skermanella stibiiresistens SB22]|uniref:Uncharacterized protein n=1 Tax=Skermanella stibiiresistens SB22 TaxID=1385369 RepID=W9GTJ0_9PROT|nr:hypothetical protein N825_36040 [Skermanella stibiiresistens SB22]